MPDEVHLSLPAGPFNDLGGRTGVVHGVGGDQIPTVRRPAQAQHMRRGRALQHTTW